LNLRRMLIARSAISSSRGITLGKEMKFRADSYPSWLCLSQPRNSILVNDKTLNELSNIC